MNKPVFIIAEAGVNHNGELKLAKKLVDAAKKAGADAVKFQAFKADELVTKSAPAAKYQRARSQYEMLKKLELSEKQFKQLSAYCRKKKIIFLATPFSLRAAIFLNRLSIKIFKISSGDLTDLPFLADIAHFKKPIILSTGMADLAEVKEAVKTILTAGNKSLALLHCTSNYPTKYEDVNLKGMATLKRTFDLIVGYSDHTPGIEIALAAVANGAKIIEKHFTLDKKLPGPDHQASLEPKEFVAMVKGIRHIEQSLGDGIKKARKSEIEVRKIARKSLVAVADIAKGVRISRQMLTAKRPGTGIAPKYLKKIIGQRTKKKISAGKVLVWSMF